MVPLPKDTAALFVLTFSFFLLIFFAATAESSGAAENVFVLPARYRPESLRPPWPASRPAPRAPRDR